MLVRFLILAALTALPGLAHAQTFPVRPVNLVVPFPPGGVADIVARSLATEMAKSLRQPVIVENRGGAAGNLGAEAVARAQADGHTVLYAVGSILTANPHLYPRMPFDALRDFAAVTEVVSGGMVLITHPSVPATTFKDLVTLAKARPGQLSYASYGNGSFPHLNMELLKSTLGAFIVHIPYRGAAPALADVVSGQVEVMFDVSTTAIPQIRAGKVRALAVNTPRRLAALPEVPAISEFIPGFDGSGWQGLFVPAATPRSVIEQLHAAAVKALAEPELRKRLNNSGLEVVARSPAELADKVRQESEKWAKVVRFAGIRID
jgi:tripartite-type tricarboxylate transporter receptor subunit TctC